MLNPILWLQWVLQAWKTKGMRWQLSGNIFPKNIRPAQSQHLIWHKRQMSSVFFYSTLSIRKHKWFIIRTWTILNQKQSHPRASTRKYQTWDQRKSWWQIFLRGPLWTLSSATCPTLCLRDDPWCARSEDTRQYLRYLNRDKYDLIKHCVTRNFTIS